MQTTETPTRRQPFAVETMHPVDVLSARLAQARALSTMLYGDDGAFDAMAPELRDGVLWALASLIDDAAAAASRIERATSAPAGGAA